MAHIQTHLIMSRNYKSAIKQYYASGCYYCPEFILLHYIRYSSPNVQAFCLKFFIQITWALSLIEQCAISRLSFIDDKYLLAMLNSYNDLQRGQSAVKSFNFDRLSLCVFVKWQSLYLRSKPLHLYVNLNAIWYVYPSFHL